MESDVKTLESSLKEKKEELQRLTDLTCLLHKMQQYLYNYYEPVQEPQKADFHFTTTEIHQQLLKIFPNPLMLTNDMVAAWLHNGGFTFYDFGNMKFEWLVKKV